jgi:hypothetical protein
MRKVWVGLLCLMLTLSASADVVVSTFTGGTPARGLNFSGNYTYAESFGGVWNNTDVMIGKAVFSNTPSAGVTVTGTGEFGLRKYMGTGPVYGDDTKLAWIMHSGYLAYGKNPSIRVAVAVTPGCKYKVHLLFSENTLKTANARRFDISVEGSKIIPNFTPIPAEAAWGGAGQPAAPHTGVMVSCEFTAGDNILNIDLTPGAGGGIRDPIINALVLEAVAIPEPAPM